MASWLTDQDALGLRLRRRRRRRRRLDEEPAGRQGRQPGRDVRRWACRCRRASPSPPRPASTTTPTARPIRPTWTARSTAGLAQGRADRPARRFGDAANPLLVSVRSGARASMPGMMDTVLNLGLNDADRRGPGQARPATAASPSTAIAASSRCIRTWCSASTTTCSRRSSTTTRTGSDVTVDTDLTAERLGGGGRRLQGRGRARAGPALPAGPATTSCGARSAPCSPAG